ncbi:MAG: DUF1579 domain-containing protein [Planctomycetes bacterium]|nr:DUF1579 domain-containing protein [Planctomycetota bacterium]
MKRIGILPLLGIVLLAALMLPDFARSEDPAEPEAPAAPDPGEMMALMKKYGSPGKYHEALGYFVGKWNATLEANMGGGLGPMGAFTEEIRWLMPGRWIVGEGKGNMMGMPYQGFQMMGYDNFKKKYVAMYVNGMETAMRTSEGVICDPTGKVIVTYGPMDEYLTGEHDKAVKYVWRIVDKDHFSLEITDLGIGENGMVVLKMDYERDA